MANYGNTIDEFVYNHCFSQIYDDICAYVHNHPTQFTGPFIKTIPVDAMLQSAILQFTSNISGDENELRFDATFSCIIELISDEYAGNEISENEIWITVSCRALIETTIELFEILSIQPYKPGQKPTKPLTPATKNIIPYIPIDQFDKEAERFLEKYWPEALVEPMAVPIERIVTEKMGLTLHRCYRLAQHATILGEICFSDMTLVVFDLFATKPYEIDVRRGTLIIDANTSLTHSLGSINNTIAHEAYHWYRHRLYASIKHLMNNTESKLQRCPTETTYPEESEKWTDEQQMEWQANRIAPRILMPAKTFSIKLSECCKEKGYISGISDISILDEITTQLAETFCVSRKSVLIRLQDFGYPEAQELINNSYSLRNATINIEADQAYILYKSDPQFQAIINSGKFCYINGSYVINHPKYIIAHNDGTVLLTEYAEEHLDECILIFKSLRSTLTPTPFISDDILHRGYSESYEYAEEENRIAIEKAEELFAKMIADRPKAKTFWEAANEHMARRKWNRSIFEEKTGLNSNIYSVGHNKPDTQVTLQTALSVCAGLQLNYESSLELLRLAGYTLNDSSQHQVYRFILSGLCFNTLEEKNAFLIKHNMQPLGSGKYHSNLE